MGVDTVICMARIKTGLVGQRKDSVTLKSGCMDKARIVNMWFHRLVTATLLLVGGAELNPGPGMKEKELEILKV
jgi:hypothetical protein